MKTDNILLVYHKEDNDGVFSAAIIYNAIINNKLNYPKITLLGADYNSLKNYDLNYFESFETVIFTDISINVSTNKDVFADIINSKKTHLIWIEHHAPAIAKYSKYNIDGYQSSDNSAIINAYKYFYEDESIPEIYRILSAYDSWTYEREGYDFDYVNNINKAITYTFKLNINIAIDFVNKYQHGMSAEDVDDFINKMLDTGKFISEYDNYRYEQLMTNYADCNWTVDGRPAAAVFVQAATNSHMFDSIINKGIKNGIVFKHNANNNWTISLYNVTGISDFDCGQYMNKYNGGGHFGAAGATVSEKNFIEMLKNKAL